MDQIFSTDNVELAKLILNDLITRDGYALSINFNESTFVDQFSHRLKIWVTPGNVRFTNTEHIDRGFVKFNEDSIIDLTETEQLEDFAYFRGYLVNTETSQN